MTGTVSYAEVAAKGPEQSPEEAYVRAPAPPEIVPNESILASDPSSNKIKVVGPEEVEKGEIIDDADTTSTESISPISPPSHPARSPGSASKKVGPKRTPEEERIRHAARKAKAAAKEKAEEAAQAVQANSVNLVAGASMLVVLLAARGAWVRGYERYTRGTLSWPIASVWAAGVGLLAVGDYYAIGWYRKTQS